MIPVFDLTRQNKILAGELKKAIEEVIGSGIFILGPNVLKFEKEFAGYIGVKYAVGVASGTDAISLALLSIGVKPGDEVIMPANAYPSVFGVLAAGAVPKLVDIDTDTFNIDPTKIESAITKKTKAILPVHLYGQPADMKKIMEIGKKYDISVVEDCAQAAGGNAPLPPLKVRGGTGELWKKVGSIGDLGCFSFYPTKNLGAFGDGGMVVTNDKNIYEKVKLLRMYGEKERYNSIIPGKNSRLDTLQAAILLLKLKYLDKWNERRREIAHSYRLCKSTSCKWPQEAPYTKHTYHLFVIRSKKRDELKKYLKEKGIGTAIHYPVPTHLVPSMKFLGYKKGDFPQSEKACNEVLSLPMFPELTDEEVIKVVDVINRFQLTKIKRPLEFGQ